MKQTAVEYLYKNLLDNPMSNEDVIYNINVFEQAKEIEKQQQGYSEEEVLTIAKDAYTMGRKGLLIGVFNKWFEQFKNKQFDK